MAGEDLPIIKESDFNAQFGAGDGTSDLPTITESQWNALNPEANANAFQKGASGFLSGISGLGDFADLVMKYATPSGIANQIAGIPTTSIGDNLRSGFDYLTGIDNSTKIGKDTWAYKVGEYLPAIMSGGDSLVADGLAGAAKSIGKIGLQDILSSSGGYIGDKVGGLPGELAGAVIGGSIPEAGQALAKGAVGLFSKIPTEEEALLNAFKGKGSEDLSALKQLKNDGIITQGVLDSPTPFSDIHSRLVGVEDPKTGEKVGGAINEKVQQITDALDGTSVKTSEILPNRSNTEFSDKIGENDLSGALKDAQENIIKKALIKLNPTKADNVEGLFKDYKRLESAASSGDPEAARKFGTLVNKMDRLNWSGDELWKIRQYYDSKINWDAPELRGKAPAWATMRDTLQGKLLNIGSQNDPNIGNHFDALSNYYGAKDLTKKLADIESTGALKAGPIGKKVIRTITSPIESAMESALRTGGNTISDPMTALKQFYGDTIPQKIGGMSLTGLANDVGGRAGSLGAILIGSALPMNDSGQYMTDQELSQQQQVPISQSGIQLILNQPSQSEKASESSSKSPSGASVSQTKTGDIVENAINRAEAKIMAKPPETPTIIAAKRVPSEDFITKAEGGQALKAYPPPAKGSGVTVATGIDLGQHSKQELRNLGVSEGTIKAVMPYLGKTDAVARMALKDAPLELTKAQANELDSAIRNDIFNTVSDKLDQQGVKMEKLPEEAQTVIKSLAYNLGPNLDEKIPTIWKAITKRDWGKVQDLLVTTKWKQPELASRRAKEASLLDSIVKV